MKLIRKKENKWIFQKNINSLSKIFEFINVIDEQKQNLSYEDLKIKLKLQNKYKGRSNSGSSNTMGVRLSEISFYMFGYTKEQKFATSFMPSPIMNNLLRFKKNDSPNYVDALINNGLTSFFTLQFPHPNSETNNNFKIYPGRLIAKLLSDDRLEKKLYIDEIIWFLPFITEINAHIYNELVFEIEKFRKLDFIDKQNMFHSIYKYDDLFSNVLHEIKYYFLKIYSQFGIIDFIGDQNHNGGNLLTFIHGKNTKRNDSFKPREKFSGYIKLSNEVINKVNRLLIKFPYDALPILEKDVLGTRIDWLNEIFFNSQLEILSELEYKNNWKNEIISKLNEMNRISKYGSRDGKDFENVLVSIFEMFRETNNVELISGSGNPDILCSMQEVKTNKFFKINIEAKTRKNSLDQINSSRLENHMSKVGSDFCIVVAPKFARGVSNDISNSRIVTITAEMLSNYIYWESLISNTKNDGYADFEPLKNIILQNLGTNITNNVESYLLNKYGTII